jgi:hypothetical protein
VTERRYGHVPIAALATPKLDNPSSVDVILDGIHISVIGSGGQDPRELVDLVSAMPASGAGEPLGDR